MTLAVIRAALILLLSVLAACGPVGASGPFVESRMPPGLSPRFWPPDNWAFGLLQLPRKPALRYGVASAMGESRGDVIILPGYGETAEAWFETVRALVARNYTVWVLEGAGQGGSGRYGPRREIGHAPDFEADIRGLLALDRHVVRPRAPPVVIASGAAGPVALAALERGYRPARVILSDWNAPAPPAGPWRRLDPQAAATPRQRAAAGWQIANPDLRLGGPSRRWRRAYENLSNEAHRLVENGATSPLTIISRNEVNGCRARADCRTHRIESLESYVLSEDAIYSQWLAAIFESLSS